MKNKKIDADRNIRKTFWEDRIKELKNYRIKCSFDIKDAFSIPFSKTLL